MSYAAIGLALAGTTAYNTGFVLEKRALAALPALTVRRVRESVRALFGSPAWLAGFGCMAAGLGCQVVVLRLLPITIAQPIQASGLGILLLLARIVLGERASGREWWRLAAVCTSVVLLGLSAGQARPGDRPADPLAVAAVVAPSVVVALGLAADAYGRSRRRRPVTGVAVGLSAGLCYGIAGLGLKGLSADTAHAGLGGALLAAVGSPYAYLAVVASGAGMVLFQTGLQRFRVSVLIPTANVAGNGYFIVLGTVLFAESLPSQPTQLALRLAGLSASALALAIRPAIDPRRPAPVAALRHLSPRRVPMALDERLLDILACALDKGPLLYFAEDAALYNPRLHRMYRIDSDVPLMRADQSRPVDADLHRELIRRGAAGEARTTLGAPIAQVLAADREF